MTKRVGANATIAFFNRITFYMAVDDALSFNASTKTIQVKLWARKGQTLDLPMCQSLQCTFSIHNSNKVPPGNLRRILGKTNPYLLGLTTEGTWEFSVGGDG
jgi:hypothetical protein